jgi:DNA integrity scanning protein DisA with diadenylate cyclase activity
MYNERTKTYPTRLHHGTVGRGRMTYIEVSNSMHARYMDWRTQPDGTRVIQTRAIPGDQYPTEAAALAAITQELAAIDQNELGQAVALGRHAIDLQAARAAFMADKPNIQRERANATLDTLMNYQDHIMPRREHLEQAFLRGHTVTTYDYDGKTEWVLAKPDRVFSIITKTEADYFAHLADSAPRPSTT